LNDANTFYNNHFNYNRKTYRKLILE